MQVELSLPNQARVLSSVRAFTADLLAQLPLQARESQALEQLVAGAVHNAVDNAYADGEEGVIRLVVSETHGKLEILIRDYGLPQDVSRWERQLHESGSATLWGSHIAEIADEAHWLAYGPQGKALQIIKWLHNDSILDNEDTKLLEPFKADAPHAAEQQYRVRRMAPEDALQISQLMYRAYGNTYFNADVYYPERIAAQNAHGKLLSIVALAEDTTVVGHYALEFLEHGPVAEGGQAVVDPAHRGRGLLNRLEELAVSEAKKLNLVGWYGDAVSVHTRTQKANVTHGGHLTAVELGIAPKTENFRKMSADQSQRGTCLLYFHWLKEPAAQKVYVPDRHRDIVTEIYENLQCPVEFGSGVAATGHGIHKVTRYPSAAGACIRAEQLGADTVHAILHARRELIERSGAEVVYVELPLADPATPVVSDALAEEGLGFLGIAPQFSTRGDLLRLAYLVEPLAREPIKTYEPFADHLVQYVLDDQKRVGKEL